MASYVRPAITSPVFRDAEGQVINYGSRWAGSPPEDTYSVETNLERFAPIHAVAEALIAYLDDTYDIDVNEDIGAASDLLHPSHFAVERAVRLRPNDASCAPITLVFTAYPGVVMHAGLLNDFHYPVCGCDACDSTWEAEADELERQIHAIVTGGYRESADKREGDAWVGFSLTYPDGQSSGGSREPAMSADHLADATATFKNLKNGWARWPESSR
jgi:hypothetical protein